MSPSCSPIRRHSRHSLSGCPAPIGAYASCSFMSPQLVDHGDAVMTHCALRCKQWFGIHWGTWLLTDEPMDEPVTRHAAATQAAEAGLPPPSFVALRHGTSDMHVRLL